MTGNLGAVGPCRVCTFVSCRRPIRPWAGFHLNVFFCEGIGEPAGGLFFFWYDTHWGVWSDGHAVLNGGLELYQKILGSVQSKVIDVGRHSDHFGFPVQITS